MEERIAVLGLGYVGLPVALAFARKFPRTIGFDVSARRVEALKRGIDETREVEPEALSQTTLEATTDPSALRGATFYVVAVPTPLDAEHNPDLGPVLRATETVAACMRPGSVIVYESTVYPGVTEDVCGPLLERVSGLRRSVDFKLGYSPERINPGDKQHSFEKITKVVSGEDEETLDRVARVYGAVVEAGVYRARSIRVAEAAKSIENVQRDLNIALMNEVALIFDRIGIRTRDVLEAARTKWNFLAFEPGLVGGHCIGVDPYYLTALAESAGYHPQVILSGRRVNEGMGPFVAQKLVKLLARADVPIRKARIGIFGLSFKQGVPDLRNTKVIDIIHELADYDAQALVHDPLVSADDALREHGVTLRSFEDMQDLDALVLAVPHPGFVERPVERLCACIRPGGAILDVKSVLDPASLRPDIQYWSL